MKVLQTRNFDPKGSYPWDDCSSRSSKYRKSHGTMVAAKAVGTQFGVAKSVSHTLLVVSDVFRWQSPLLVYIVNYTCAPSQLGPSTIMC
jgi:hypothetical protein